MKRTMPMWQAKVDECGDEKGGIEWGRGKCKRYLYEQIPGIRESNERKY